MGSRDGRAKKYNTQRAEPDWPVLLKKLERDPEALELVARMMEKLAERSPRRPR